LSTAPRRRLQSYFHGCVESSSRGRLPAPAGACRHHSGHRAHHRAPARADGATEARVVTLGSHQRSIGETQNHITPKWIMDKSGPYDLDPAAADPRPWDCAQVNWSCNGLDRPWFGSVYLNPPFNRYEVGEWIARLAQHNCGITLLHARVEAGWFEPCWRH